MPDAVQREAILKLILRRAQAERLAAYGGVEVAQSLAQVTVSVCMTIGKMKM